MRLALVLATLSFASCQSQRAHFDRLSTYEAAMACARPEPPVRPVLFVGLDAVPQDELVPYAVLPGSRAVDFSPSIGASYSYRRAVQVMPDAIAYREGGMYQAGQIHAYWGYGVSTTSNVNLVVNAAICFREAPAKLPFRMAPSAMVTVIDPIARDCGLLEGDTVLSIDGFAVTPHDDAMRSEHLVGRLRLRPGAPVRVIAIRPGTGRVEASVTPIENPRSYRTHHCGVDTARYDITVARAPDGSIGWRCADPHRWDVEN